MLIDFHTHIYPDKIAAQFVPATIKHVGLPYVAAGNVDDAKVKMKEWGVDKSVVLHIATNPEKHAKVNDFAFSISDGELISFCSVHPLAKDAAEELDRIKAAGIIGIKLHPEYQGYFITDQRVYPIYERISGLGFITVFHAGIDIGFDTLMAPVDAIAKLVKDFPRMKIVLAHMGGYRLWDEVMDSIAGSHVYLDTAFIARAMPKNMAEALINKHGAEKILFGSDCPWMGVPEIFKYVDSLNISAKEKDLIFCDNAQRILADPNNF